MKTLNRITLVSIILLSLLALSCEDVFEEDITNDMVQISYPTNNTVIESNAVSFRWNDLDGATKYRIQVIGSNQVMVLDSLVTKNSFTYGLAPGAYQWRVRGENFAYQSAYNFPVNFTLIQTQDLTNQQIILSSPANGLYTKALSLTCSWQPINVADYYEIELINVTNGQTIAYQESNIVATSVTLNNSTLSEDAEYQWKIKAVNTTSQTAFTSRTFFIDRIAPNQPQNSLPATNSTQLVNLPIDFSLVTSTDIGIIQSPIVYTIEFSNDISFASIIQSSTSTSATFQQTFSTAGNYFWRVKAIDTAGNSSTYSSPFKFIIN